MKQVIQNYKTGELEIEEVPVPLLQEGGAIVRTCFSLISAGTERSTLDISKKSIVGKARARPDLVKKVIATSKKIGVKNTIELVLNRLNAPVPLGYSLAGIVEKVSDGVVGITVGDRVACAGAGYANHAERAFVPQNLMAIIPEVVSEKDAAFTTVGSIALHGVRQANVGVGDLVGVIGLGLVGQLTVALLKAQGSRVIGIDLDEYAVNLSKTMGVDEALLRNAPFLGEAIQKFSGQVGLDAVLITAGTDSNDPFELASEILRDKGTLVVVGGIRMEIVKSVSSLFYLKEIDIKFSRSYGPGRYDPNYEEKGIDYPIGFVRWTEKRNMECFLDMLASGRLNLNPLITHTFPFENAIEAYGLITGKTREPYLGVLLQYGTDRKPESPRIMINHKTKPIPGHIGIGMIGAGSFAQSNILPHLKSNSNVVLRGLCTSKGMTAKSVAGKFGFSYCSSNSDEIINDKDNHVIFIATRHDSHGKYVIESL
ncbi:MAG: zinc-binding dehydrogenase, partial [Desulfobacteraceae bacterium]|nr:zinc-binding dehydrogenase [Desulfobacteraceae bacterium]